MVLTMLKMYIKYIPLEKSWITKRIHMKFFFPTLNINTYNYIIEICVMNLRNVFYDEILLFPISIGVKL
jgi:hypothetical protein